MKSEIPTLIIPTLSENTKCETADVCVGVAEEAVRNTTGRVNTPRSAGVELNPPDNMHMGSTSTGTDPTLWNRTC